MILDQVQWLGDELTNCAMVEFIIVHLIYSINQSLPHNSMSKIHVFTYKDTKNY